MKVLSKLLSARNLRLTDVTSGIAILHATDAIERTTRTVTCTTLLRWSGSPCLTRQSRGVAIWAYSRVHTIESVSFSSSNEMQVDPLGLMDRDGKENIVKHRTVMDYATIPNK